MLHYVPLLLVLGLLHCSFIEDADKPTPSALETTVAEGCPNASYPLWSSSPYVLPYPVGKSYTVNLTHCTGSAHRQGVPDQYAIDFDMPIGTQITAARAGIVLRLDESAKDYGGGFGNFVIVDHGDKTFGVYGHFTQGGVDVEVGDRVEPGSPIGKSGASGLAGYPHLHFVVVKGSPDWPYVSMPYTFRNTNPNPRSLASGYTYTALPY